MLNNSYKLSPPLPGVKDCHHLDLKAKDVTLPPFLGDKKGLFAKAMLLRGKSIDIRR